MSKSPGPSSPKASSLLVAWREGDESALNKLVPLVYNGPKLPKPAPTPGRSMRV
jgi:hypothetical protein